MSAEEELIGQLLLSQRRLTGQLAAYQALYQHLAGCEVCRNKGWAACMVAAETLGSPDTPEEGEQ